MSLDQTLSEIEPILRATDSTFQFTHPSFQEVLTVKQFADEINSGELSIRDAYVNFWSYEEDVELWDLPKDREWRALLPAWYNILCYLPLFLEQDKTKNLVDALVECCSEAIKVLSKEDYNPFREDYFFADLISRIHLKTPLESDKLVQTWSFLNPRELLSIFTSATQPENLVAYYTTHIGHRGGIASTLDCYRWSYFDTSVMEAIRNRKSLQVFVRSQKGQDGIDYSHLIRRIHPHLKPQGYNPAVKRLVV